jgi:hypothetical protein
VTFFELQTTSTATTGRFSVSFPYGKTDKYMDVAFVVVILYCGLLNHDESASIAIAAVA